MMNDDVQHMLTELKHSHCTNFRRRRVKLKGFGDSLHSILLQSPNDRTKCVCVCCVFQWPIHKSFAQVLVFNRRLLKLFESTLQYLQLRHSSTRKSSASNPMPMPMPVPVRCTSAAQRRALLDAATKSDYPQNSRLVSVHISV